MVAQPFDAHADSSFGFVFPSAGGVLGEGATLTAGYFPETPFGDHCRVYSIRTRGREHVPVVTSFETTNNFRWVAQALADKLRSRAVRETVEEGELWGAG